MFRSTRNIASFLFRHHSPLTDKSAVARGCTVPRLVNSAWSKDRTSRSFQVLAEQRQITPQVLEVGSEELHTQELLPIDRLGDIPFAKTLPVACPGCGALSQTVEPDAPGFFSQQKGKTTSEREHDEAAIFRDAMNRLKRSDGTVESSQDVDPTQESPQQIPKSTHVRSRPICDRCHDLIHQSKGQPIVHPSMISIREMIEASPYQRNHIYHVVDAADFPMSLIPNLVASLDLPKLRTRNRRSRTMHYSKGRTADVTFIITRSDLLAPQKEQVDRMMPYLQDILRESLGRSGRKLRLGNVRCVSAKRGWWTPSVKQDIWERGGAGWVVGKANVGKSALFEVVFPKGRSYTAEEAKKLAAVRDRSQAQPDEVKLATTTLEIDEDRSEEVSLESKPVDTLEFRSDEEENGSLKPFGEVGEPIVEDNDSYLEDQQTSVLLPPVQPETQYPVMPVVSALPGTTASPIRVPYGKGRGELIDLPGVQRSSMETHVLPEHHASLIMKSRVVPEQQTIKPGQSLLIGGIIRIAPKTDDLIFLAYPFTPLKAHVTRDEKAIAIQTGKDQDGMEYAGNVQSIATPTAKQRIKSAGTFQLEWDVTKLRTGPLTARNAAKVKVENLPFTVYSADILIESIGWVELVCQVRNRRSNPENPFPEVEVFTPKGKFISVRKPMNAWLLGGPKKVPRHAVKARPRMSISMEKRKEGGRKGGQTMGHFATD